jgi:hypothetical protein
LERGQDIFCHRYPKNTPSLAVLRWIVKPSIYLDLMEAPRCTILPVSGEFRRRIVVSVTMNSTTPDPPPASSAPSEVRVATDAAVVLREDFRPDTVAAREMFEKTLSLLHALKSDR